MQQLIVDYGTLIAFSAIAIDLVFQINRVWKRRSSADISLAGFTIRFFASIILLAKYMTLSDSYLFGGQVVVLSLLIVYFWLIIKFRPKPEPIAIIAKDDD